MGRLILSWSNCKETVMKTILVLLALFSFSAVAGEMKILKDSSGYSIIKEEAKDTGLVMQEGLVLTREQLAHVIETKEPLPLNVEKKNQRWDKYLLHIEYENVSMEQVVLEGTMVKKIQKMVTEKRETFNPFFICALIYVLAMVTMYSIKGKDFAIVGPAIMVAVAATLAATLAVAFVVVDTAPAATLATNTTTLLATLVATLLATLVAAAGKSYASLIGIGLMTLFAMAMYLFV